MRKTTFFKTGIAIASIALFSVGCTSESASTIDDLKVASADNAQSSSISDDVVSTVDGFVNKAETTLPKLSIVGMSKAPTIDSAGVKIDIVRTSLSNYPITVTIDFGTTGFTGKRGNVFKGKVIVTVSGIMLIPGSVRTIKYQNFSINDNAVTGTKTVTCKSPLSWGVVANDTITRASDGAKITYNVDQTRNYVPAGDDSYFFIQGTASGVNAKGKSYTAEITTGLKIFVNYKHIVSGLLTVKSGAKTAIIDYGNGTRDDQAKVTIGVKTYDITLK
jgi:hypothetical protein